MRYLILATLISCQTSLRKPTSTPITNPPNVGVLIVPTPLSQPNDTGHVSVGSISIGPEYPVADVKKIFTVKIENTNYTADQKVKLKKAEELIAKVFNSDKFKNRVLKHIHNKKIAFDSNNGLSNQQIHDKLFAGAESLIPAVNYQMDLKVSMYYKRNIVIGYTTPSSMIVNTNSKFHNGFEPCEIASNLSHEWVHKMGFGHNSATSYNSVPYAIGYLVGELCKEL